MTVFQVVQLVFYFNKKVMASDKSHITIKLIIVQTKIITVLAEEYVHTLCETDGFQPHKE
jgi:hypothetical protein